jgi:hypothetical protein
MREYILICFFALYIFRCITIATNEDTNDKKSAKAVLTVAKVLDWEAFDTLYLTIIVEDINTDKAFQDQKFSSG